MDDYSEHQVAFILKNSKAAVNKNKVKLQTLGTTKLQAGEDGNDSPLIEINVNSFECHLTTKGLRKVTCKKNSK